MFLGAFLSVVVQYFEYIYELSTSCFKFKGKAKLKACNRFLLIFIHFTILFAANV